MTLDVGTMTPCLVEKKFALQAQTLYKGLKDQWSIEESSEQ